MLAFYSNDPSSNPAEVDSVITVYRGCQTPSPHYAIRVVEEKFSGKIVAQWSTQMHFIIKFPVRATSFAKR